MRKNSKLLIASFVLLSFARAQRHSVDSLEMSLRTTNQDSTRCLLMAKLSYEYVFSKPDTSILLAQQALVLARQINFPKGEAEGLRMEALVFSETGNDAKAFELSLQSLRIAERIHDQSLQAEALTDVGYVYADQGDFNKALNYDFQAKEIAMEMKDDYHLMVLLINLGDDYEKIGKLDSARFYTTEAFDLAVKERNAEAKGLSLSNLGNIYAKMEQTTIAMDNYRMSIPYWLESKNDNVCETTLGMAKLFQNMGQDDSCLHYARLSFLVAQENNFEQRLLDASKFLANYYKRHHIVDSAYTYLSKVIDAKDSLFSQEKINRIKTLDVDEAFRQQEIAVNKEAAQKERNKNIQYGFTAVGLITFILIFLLLTQSIIVNERWIRFLGILGLLLLFEFINLFVHPYLSTFTHDSPILMLGILVALASLLIPMHHRLEFWVIDKMVAKNRKLRLAAAKRTVAKLEGNET